MFDRICWAAAREMDSPARALVSRTTTDLRDYVRVILRHALLRVYSGTTKRGDHLVHGRRLGRWPSDRAYIDPEDVCHTPR